MYVSLKVSSFFYAFGLKVSIFSLCLWPYDNSMLIKPISLFFSLVWSLNIFSKTLIFWQSILLAQISALTKYNVVSEKMVLAVT